MKILVWLVQVAMVLAAILTAAGVGIVAAIIGCVGNLYSIYHRDDEEEHDERS